MNGDGGGPGCGLGGGSGAKPGDHGDILGGVGGSLGTGGGREGGSVVQSQTAGSSIRATSMIGMARRIGAGVFCTLVSAPHCFSLIETTGVERVVAFSSDAACTLDSKVVTDDVTASDIQEVELDCRRRLPDRSHRVPTGSVSDAAAGWLPIGAPSSAVPSKAHASPFLTLIAIASVDSFDASSPVISESLSTSAIVSVVLTSVSLIATDSARIAATSGGGVDGGNAGGGGGKDGGNG